MNVHGRWRDPADDERVSRLGAQRLHARLAPHATGSGYVNFMTERRGERVAATLRPATIARLQALKRRFDPANLFRMNQNIAPR